jgi:hypothetical protein
MELTDFKRSSRSTLSHALPVTPSAYWITYVFTVLIERGREQDVVDLIKKHWLPMVEHGTTWEAFTPDPATAVARMRGPPIRSSISCTLSAASGRRGRPGARSPFTRFVTAPLRKRWFSHRTARFGRNGKSRGARFGSSWAFGRGLRRASSCPACPCRSSVKASNGFFPLRRKYVQIVFHLIPRSVLPLIKPGFSRLPLFDWCRPTNETYDGLDLKDCGGGMRQH